MLVTICPRPRLNDELDGTGAHVVDGARCCHGSLAHLLAQRRRHAGCGRLLQHLLMAPLDRAVAFEQVDVVAKSVAEHLNFYVAWPLHVFLDQHSIVAKTVDGLALTTGQCRRKVFRPVHCAHALATATGTGLDQHRVTDGIGFALQQRGVLFGAVITRYQGHTGQTHQPLGLGLQAHRLHG